MLAHQLLETPHDERGLFHLHDGTYAIFGDIEDGKFRMGLRKVEPAS
jgi:hypothetical protein